MQNIPGISKIELILPDSSRIDACKIDTAKASIKRSLVGTQTLYDIEVEFTSFKEIDLTKPYHFVITAVSGVIYQSGNDSDPYPVITSEYKDGDPTGLKGYIYKVTLKTYVKPFL